MNMSIYDYLVTVHAAAGIGGAVGALAPIATPKGRTFHKFAGRIVLSCMGITSLTGFAISSIWLLEPSVYGPLWLAVLLCGLATMVGTATWRGWRAVRLHGARYWSDRIVIVLALMIQAGVTIGGWLLSNWIVMALGLLMMASLIREGWGWRPRNYIDEHIIGTVGAVVGALSGFFIIRSWLLMIPLLMVASIAVVLWYRRRFQNQGW